MRAPVAWHIGFAQALRHCCGNGQLATWVGNTYLNGDTIASNCANAGIRIMNSGPNRLLDELAKLMTDAAGAAQGVRREAETAIQAQLERLLNSMDLVKREEFEAVRDMAAKAREENDALSARLDELEKKLAAKPAAKTASKTASKAGSKAGTATKSPAS
jgi:BMFP domain-containing protein YqiC